HLGEVLLAAEGLRIDLVDVLRARGTGREPCVLGGDLQSADRTARGGLGDRGDDRLPGELRRRDLLRAERLERRLLLPVRWRVGARVGAGAELLDQLRMEGGGGAAGDRKDLRG